MAAKPYNLNLPPLPNYDNELAMIGGEQLANLRQPAGQPVSQFTAEVPGIKIPQFEIPPAPSYTPYSQTEEGKKVIEELTKKKQEAEERQQAEMNAARMQLQDYLGKQKAISYLPIAALVDTWTGSNLAKYYKDDEDQSKQMAMELQKELLKYGNLGVENQLDALKNQLGLGSEEAKTGANLARQAYDAELRAKQAMFDTTIDAATKLKAAEEARKAAADLEKFRQQNRIEVAKIRQSGRGASEARQEKKDIQQGLFKLESVPEYRGAPKRENLLNVLNAYEDAVKSVNDITSIPGATKTKLENAYNAYKIAQKEADNLGALTGPDVGIITGQVPDATSVALNLEDMARRGLSNFGLAESSSAKQNILDSIQRARQKLLESHETSLEYLRNTFPEQGFDEAINRVDKSFKQKLRSSGKGNQPVIINKQQEVTPSAMTLDQKKAYLEKLKKERGIK